MMDYMALLSLVNLLPLLSGAVLGHATLRLGRAGKPGA